MSESHQITYSLNDIFEIKKIDLQEKVFKFTTNMFEEKYVKIKKIEFTIGVVNKEVLQINDISKSILYKQVVGEKEMLTLINATVSHEMRNPCNSIEG